MVRNQPQNVRIMCSLNWAVEWIDISWLSVLKIKLQGHNDSVVILRNKTTFFVLKTSFNSSTSFVVISSKCVTAENFHTPSTEGIGNSWCQRFFRKGGGGGGWALKKNQFHGKNCAYFPQLHNGFTYCLKKGGGGGGGVRFEMQERLESSFFYLVGWFSNRMETSFDNGKANGKD